jgi:hypothetical protein
MKSVVTLALVAAAACGGLQPPPPPASTPPPTGAPPPLASTTLPDGSQLAPYDPAQPGKARPQGMAAAGGRAYITLANQRDTANVPVNAGPGFLAALVPSTGEITRIDLGGTDRHQCQNPGVVRASADGKLYASCSGDFSGSDEARAIVEVDPASNTMTRRAAIPDGLVPNGIAVTPTKIWTGDTSSARVFRIDRATFTADAAPAVPLDCPKTKDTGFTYTPDVIAVGNDVYALCASDIAGALFRLDGATGAVIGQTAVGAGPTELTALDDGRIAVVNFLDNTLSLVAASASGTLTSTTALTFSSQTSGLQDIRAVGHILFTVASGSNTAQRIDLQAQGGPRVVSEANFGPGAGPWNILPLDAVQAIVTNRGTNTVAAAQWVDVK